MADMPKQLPDVIFQGAEVDSDDLLAPWPAITAPGPFTIAQPKPVRELHFMAPGGTTVAFSVHLEDGSVTLADGWGVDEAAALFWERVRALGRQESGAAPVSLSETAPDLGD